MKRRIASSAGPHRAGPGQSRRGARAAAALLAVGVAGLAAGCQKQDAGTAKQPLLVRVATAEVTDYARRRSLTGVIAARVVDNLAFRVGGRVAERLVDIGEHVDKGQVLARLDPETQQSDLRAAQAARDAAGAQLAQSQAAFDRQKKLLAEGFTTRREYDDAEQALKIAEGNVEAAESQVANAAEALTFTELRAAAPGIVTSWTIETGQVVQAAQTVFTVAEDGDRDAVFNVQEAIIANTPSSPLVTVSLVSDPEVSAVGRVREVSPVISSTTGTVRVKVTVADTPPGMVLGAAIAGSVVADPVPAVVLPWQALTSSAGAPAV